MQRRLTAFFATVLVLVLGAACGGVQEQLERRAQEEVDKQRQRVEKEVDKQRQRAEEKVRKEATQLLEQ